jgi:hypothetical protein
MTATAENVRRVRLRERHRAQQQIVDEAERFNVLQCGRRFGKTTLGVDLDVDVAVSGQPVGWFAPTYKFLDEAWREVRRAVLEITKSVDKQQRRIELIGGGSVEFWTMDHPDPGRGRKYARVVIDEAGIVRDLKAVWTEAIRPTLTDLKGDAWFLGTPKGRGYFHELFQRGQDGRLLWKSWRFHTVDNPYIDAAEVEEARGELPDLAFRQEYLGEAVEDGSNPFGIEFIRQCTAPLSDAPPEAFGVDLARKVDYSVILGLDAERRTCRFERFQIPWPETFDKVRRTVGGVMTLVDASGVGDPIHQQLARTAENFIPFQFAAKTRQQLLESLAVTIQEVGVRFPDGPIVRELESFGYEYTRTGGVKYLAPEGLHDDCVMGLALALEMHKRSARTVGRYGTIKARS